VGPDLPVRLDVQGDPLPPQALARLGTIRWRHGAAITFVAHLPDGKGLITDSLDGTLRLWDLSTGTELHRFKKDSKPVEDGLRILGFQRNERQVAALSADGKLLAGGDANGTITLWDVATAKPLRTLKPPDSTPLAALVFSGDSELLLAKDFNQVLRIWDVSAGRLLRTFARRPDGQDIGFQAGAFTGPPVFLAGGDVAASVYADIKDGQFTTALRRWDQVTGRELAPIVLTDNGDPTTGVAFAPDGKTMGVAGGLDEQSRLVDLGTGKELRKFDGLGTKSFITQLTFSPDGKTLAAWSSDQTMHFWDTANGKRLRRIGEPTGPRFNGIYFFRGSVSNLAFSPDGKILTLGSSGSSVRRWMVETGQELLPFAGHQGTVVELALSADGKTAITRGADHTIHSWDLATGMEISRLILPGDSTRASLAPDGRTVALGDPEGKLRLWDVQSAKEICQWQVGQLGFVGLAFSADGKTLASRGVDRIVHLWDPATGKELREIGEAKEGESAASINVFGGLRGTDIPNLGFLADGTTLIAIAPVDGRILRQTNDRDQAPPPAPVRLWDASTGRPSRPFEPLRTGVVYFAAAPDGRTIATASIDGSVLLWETLTGKVRLRIQPTVKGVSDTLAFSPDSRTLAGSGPGGTIRLWDAVTGQEMGKLTGHQGTVQALRFTTDGKRLISGSADTTAILWDLEPLLKSAPATSGVLADGNADAMWHALTGRDAERAHLAVIKLVGASAQALPVLRQHLHPVPAPDADKIAQLLEAVDSKDLTVRQKAFAELDRLADLAEQPLKDSLAAQPSLERRQRLERLQDRLLTGATLRPEQVQALRAVEILEKIGSAEARAILQDLSRGAAGARLTQQAQAALERLSRPRRHWSD
jgi:WD40 repeat protein